MELLRKFSSLQIKERSDDVDNTWSLLEQLPRDALIQVFRSLDMREIIKCSLVCKRFHTILDSDLFWAQLCSEQFRHDKPPQITWKEYYIHLHAWKFSSDILEKSIYIELDNNGLEALRSSTAGTNPCLRCTRPAGFFSDYFEVAIVRKGRWISVGLQEKTFTLNKYRVCGSGEDPENGFNCGYYSGTSTHHYVKLNGVAQGDGTAPTLKVGDTVGVLYKKAEKKIVFYRNQTVVQEITIEEDNGKAPNSHYSWDQMVLYPAVSLGYQAHVRIIKSVAPKV